MPHIGPAKTTPAAAGFRTWVLSRGGQYIAPEENAQPDPNLRIASIHLDGVTGVGLTEFTARADWWRAWIAKCGDQA